MAYVPGAGANTFTGLADAPASYSGAGSRHVRVKGDETGLEFANLGGLVVPGDADVTITPGTNGFMDTIVVYSTPLTATRTVTLSTTGAFAGLRYRVLRRAGGAFSLSVGGLASLSLNEWADVYYNGESWILLAAGGLEPGGGSGGGGADPQTAILVGFEADQSQASSSDTSWTSVVWPSTIFEDTEVFDYDDMTGEIEVLEAGVYDISLAVVIENPSSGTRRFQGIVQIDPGTGFADVASTMCFVSDPSRNSGHARHIAVLDAGDKVRVQFRNIDNGLSVNIRNGASLTVVKLRDVS